MFRLIVVLVVPLMVVSLDQMSLEVSIDEEQPNGTILLDFTSRFSPNSSSLSAKFLRPCPHFFFDQSQVPLLLRSTRLDREQLCPRADRCRLSCDILVQHHQTTLVRLLVDVNDINDHQPMFSKRFYSLSVAENIPVGSRLQLEQAQDQDSTLNNSISRYILLDITDDFPFELDFDRSHHLLSLVVRHELDFEEKQNYKVQLKVFDGNDRDDQIELRISILNVNDCPPIFDSPFYQFRINAKGFVGRVHAEDRDLNDHIDYRFASSINEQFFSINATSGELFCLTDRIDQRHFQFIIEAIDSAFLSSLTTVDVLIDSDLRSNDNDQPQDTLRISIPKLFRRDSSDKVFVRENSRVPLTLAQLFFSSSLDLQTSPTPIDHFTLIRTDEQSFELLLLKPFDREQISTILVEFRSNNQTKINNKSLEIIVIDENDCEPRFDNNKYRLQIEENNNAPHPIHTFCANDPDEGQINYQIDTEDSNLFWINSTSGQLWAMESLDREKQSSYRMSVCASDSIHRTCATVILAVLDQNDNVCAFDRPALSLTIDENLPTNSFLARIVASDPDQDENGRLIFHLSPPSPHLHLDPSKPVLLTTNLPFDREQIDSLATTIVACDQPKAKSTLCCHLPLRLTIRDRDDHPPVLLFPPPDQLTIISVDHHTMPRLRAVDADIDPINRIILFAISGGSLQSAIAVDRLSGQLSLLPEAQLPLHGTLHISLSSQSFFRFSLLLHDNRTDPQTFLMSITSSSARFFYITLALCIGTGLLAISIVVVLCWCHRLQRDDDPLMNTPSTTTLSTNRKIYDTYYSFNDNTPGKDIHI